MPTGKEDENDNLVIRMLREMREVMVTKESFDEFRAEVGKRFDDVDERFVKVEMRLSDVQGIALKTHGELITLSRRLERIEQARLVERVEALERSVAELRKASH